MDKNDILETLDSLVISSEKRVKDVQKYGFVKFSLKEQNDTFQVYINTLELYCKLKGFIR